MDMREIDKIFMKDGNVGYGIPEGYFTGLQARLGAIPSMKTQSVSHMQRVMPYLALAACFLAILCVGNFVIGSTADSGTTGDWYNEAAYAELMTMPEEAFNTVMSEQDTISDDDVINYLISSGTPTELIEYSGLIAKK